MGISEEYGKIISMQVCELANRILQPQSFLEFLSLINYIKIMPCVERDRSEIRPIQTVLPEAVVEVVEG